MHILPHCYKALECALLNCLACSLLGKQGLKLGVGMGLGLGSGLSQSLGAGSLPHALCQLATQRLTDSRHSLWSCIPFNHLHAIDSSY